MLFFLTKHHVPLMFTILCLLKFLFPKRLPFIAIEHLNNTVSKILHRTEPSKFDSLFQLNDQHRGTIFILSHRLPHSMRAPHAMRDPLHTEAPWDASSSMEWLLNCTTHLTIPAGLPLVQYSPFLFFYLFGEKPPVTITIFKQ